MSGSDGCYGEKQNRIRGARCHSTEKGHGEGTLVMIDQGPGGSEGMSEARIWEKVFRAEGTAQAKVWQVREKRNMLVPGRAEDARRNSTLAWTPQKISWRAGWE